MTGIQGPSNLGPILKGPLMARAMRAKADEIARNIEGLEIKVGDHDGGAREYPLPVKVEQSVTDRARARVVLAHPAGQAVQAKHGALTRAAAQAGVEVKNK